MNEPKNNQAERNRMLHARQAAAQTTKQAHQSTFPDRQPERKRAKADSQSGSSGQANVQTTIHKAKEKGAGR